MSRATSNPVPVVMLRSGHHGGLGIARTLGRMGVPVYSVDADWWESAVFSRYCSGRFLLDVGNAPRDAAVAGLRRIADRIGGRPVLIPTTDETCIWVAANTSALREHFRFLLPDALLVQTLCDKNRMQDLARKHGVPTAHSVLPQSREDIVRFCGEAEFPVMVKETGGGRLRRRAGGTKFLCRTAQELIDLYTRVGDPEEPNLIVQEFIPGEDWMFNGYFDDNSLCLFGLTGRKIRRFPMNTGVTSLGICASNETVSRLTIDFMQAIGYRGILDIGFRRDQRDGRYKVLDVNPRIGCTFRLFTDSGGLDVARALYLNLTGRPVAAAPAVDGRKWLVEDFDLASAFRAWRERKLSLKDWIRSLAGVRETACFALDDPLPSLMIGVTDCCELYRWCRGQSAARHPQKSAPPVPLFMQRRY
jgi:D-aspartate ligase